MVCLVVIDDLTDDDDREKLEDPELRRCLYR